MSADGVVARLQAALDETERVATAAAQVPRGHKQGNHRQARGLTVTLPARAWTDYVAHMEPGDVLRLVQAHRDILDDFKVISIHPDVLTDPALSLEAKVLLHVLRRLARGYGVEDA